MNSQQKALHSLKQKVLADMEGPLTVNAVISIMERSYLTVDANITQWMKVNSNSVACKQGCSHCCNQTVWTTEPEVIYISETLRHNYSEDKLTSIRDYFFGYAERLKDLKVEERFALSIPCPFLQNSECHIYPFRPSACRGLYSADADKCDKTKNPKLQTPYVQQPGEIAMGIRSAVISALYEKGVYSHNLELISAMTIALSDPTSGEQWLARENPFSNAIVQYEAVDITLVSRASTGDAAAMHELEKYFSKSGA